MPQMYDSAHLHVCDNFHKANVDKYTFLKIFTKFNNLTSAKS